MLSIDTDYDTMDISGIGLCPSASSVPIFYHCEHDVVERGNGALEGAAGAFYEDDKVIVQCEITGASQYNPLYVIGFADIPPRVCEFEFFIRPTFNGYTPTKGGQRIKVEHPDYDFNDPNDKRSERDFTSVTGDYDGLCGPFTSKVGTGAEYVYLDYYNYWHSTILFEHFYEVPQAEADYHIGYGFPDYADYPTIKRFNVGDAPPLSPAILHVNRALWRRYDDILSLCTKTTETIGGTEYIVYLINFDELYSLTLTTIGRQLDLHVTPTCTQGCGPISISPVGGDVTSRLPMIQNIDNIGPGTGGPLVCDGYGWPMPQSEWKAESFITYNNHTPVFTLDPTQICILSSEFGQNPIYPGLTIHTNFYIRWQIINFPWSGGSIPDVCEINDTDYPGLDEHSYTKELTPEEEF